jgi:hypothetical protein
VEADGRPGHQASLVRQHEDPHVRADATDDELWALISAFAGRLDICHANMPACREKISDKPSSYLKRIFFDTVVFQNTISNRITPLTVSSTGGRVVQLGLRFSF